MLTRLMVIALLSGLAAGCEGPMGPAGPSGPQGPQGPQGPAGPGSTSYFFSGRLDSQARGGAVLPTAAGSIGRLPQVQCYIAETAGGPYFQIATDLEFGFTCAVVQEGGQLVAVVLMGTTASIQAQFAGSHYQIVVRAQNE